MSVEDANTKNVPFLFSCRFLIAILICFAIFCNVTMRTDLGIAMVCMVNSTAYLNENESVTTIETSFKLPCKRQNLSELLLKEGYTVMF